MLLKQILFSVCFQKKYSYQAQEYYHRKNYKVNPNTNGMNTSKVCLFVLGVGGVFLWTVIYYGDSQNHANLNGLVYCILSDKIEHHQKLNSWCFQDTEFLAPPTLWVNASVLGRYFLPRHLADHFSRGLFKIDTSLTYKTLSRFLLLFL